MTHQTTIDTIGIQIDFNSTEEQRGLLDSIIKFTIGLSSLYVGNKDRIVAGGVNIREYAIYANNTTVATITTGMYRSGSNANYMIKYYVSIKFAGLKTYDPLIDAVSQEYLLKICAHLNTIGVIFKLTELDVCIDAECPFENISVVCIKKTPKTQYYDPMEYQVYDKTTYIEKIPKGEQSKRVLRAYVYDKSSKENLSYSLTRFEIKLQPKYFNKYGFKIEVIQKAFDRYCVMYFERIYDKQNMMSAYMHHKTPVRKKEAIVLGMNNYRLFPDIQYIYDFLYKILHIDNFSFDYCL